MDLDYFCVLFTRIVGEVTRHVDDDQYCEEYGQNDADDNRRTETVGVGRRYARRYVRAWKYNDEQK